MRINHDYVFETKKGKVSVRATSLVEAAKRLMFCGVKATPYTRTKRTLKYRLRRKGLTGYLQLEYHPETGSLERFYSTFKREGKPLDKVQVYTLLQVIPLTAGKVAEMEEDFTVTHLQHRSGGKDTNLGGDMGKLLGRHKAGSPAEPAPGAGRMQVKNYSNIKSNVLC
ncbi:hypothetical protein V6R21_18950 [Limibacter armeniacum]|uniref:hypothetical protein n=1 Tax=Limibacter armeniacum TaxID=466084 RepID=UPI002FE5104F